MIKRLYLAGPMTGIAQLNFPAFHAEAARLRQLGYEVINPAELNNEDANAVFANDEDRQTHWRKCMRVDLTQLLKCDSVALLDGWTASKGARLEQHVAYEMGMAPRLAAFFVEPPSGGVSTCNSIPFDQVVLDEVTNSNSKGKNYA